MNINNQTNKIFKADDVAWYKLSVKATAEKQGVDIKTGLSHEEASRRLEVYGKNRLPDDQGDSYLDVLLRQFKSPMVYILLFAAFITLSLREFSDTIIISLAVIVNIVVGFAQEQKANRTLAELKKVIKPSSTVWRKGRVHTIRVDELVPGDVIFLAAGDRVPADARLYDAEKLEIVEASLTGESMPSVKQVEELPHNAPLADQDSMVFMGTEIAFGKGRAIVIATGKNTEIGSVARLLSETREEITPLQRSLNGFSKLVAWVTLGISVLLILIGIVRDQDFFDMLITAVAVAVAAIPEGLLISLTVILAIGMQRILRKRGLVRRMAAAETLGATTIICTDKTGTLTLGEMRVTSLVSAFEELQLSKRKIEVAKHKYVLEILEGATHVNEAIVKNSEEQIGDWKIIGNPTDKALLIAAAEVGFHQATIDKQSPQIAEIPFDGKRKYACSLRKQSGRAHMLYVKGAAEIILGKSTFIARDGSKVKAEDADIKKLNKKFTEMTKAGLRVLGVARRSLPVSVVDFSDEASVVSDLVFLGFVGLRDPVRQEVPATMMEARSAGVRTVIVTGDHKLTAAAIARETGLDVYPTSMMDGQELDNIDDDELIEKVVDISIFARVTPAHKLRIIDAWQKRGHVVAMTGDGVNDAPALKKADIGVCLGSGTEVAKQASDLVLLDNNFKTIIAAIGEGRGVFNNIRKVIVYLLSDSFTAVILIAGALLLGLPLPLLPAQILWNNLVTDGLPNLALTVEPASKDVMKEKPRNAKEPLLNSKMRQLILTVGILTDIVLLFLFTFLIDRIDIATARTVMFAAFGFNSLVYAFSIKDLSSPIWKIPIFNNRWLIGAVGVGVALMLFALLHPSAQTLLDTVAIPAYLWWWIIGLSAIKLIAIEITKGFYRLKEGL